MAIYVVVPLGANKEKLSSAVQALGEENFYQLDGHGWLVKFAGTSKELCAKIGIPVQKDQFQDDSPTALVTLLAGHFGYASGEMWDWVRSRSEA